MRDPSAVPERYMGRQDRQGLLSVRRRRCEVLLERQHWNRLVLQHEVPLQRDLRCERKSTQRLLRRRLDAYCQSVRRGRSDLHRYWRRQRPFLLQRLPALRQLCRLVAMPSGTFADKVAKACLPCADPDASSCTDGKVGSALACNTQYLSLGICVAAADIPDGYYPDDTTRTAKPCDTGVTKCTGPGDGNALACGSDAAGTPYFLTPDASCLTQCDWGTGGSLPSHTCVECDSAAGILNCDAQGARQCGYNSDGELTYLTPTHACELSTVNFPGYYPDDTTATFEPCDDGVETCVGLWDDQALSCGTRKDGTDLFFVASSDASEDASLGYCVVAADCPDGTTADIATHICMA